MSTFSVRKFLVGSFPHVISPDCRMLSESTSLIPLTQLHQESPSSPHYLRTRAITRSLKGDYLPAIKDLTAALSLVKALTDHQSQSGIQNKSRQKGLDVSPDMECQCVFQRGGCYLTLAIRYAGRVTKTLQKPTLQPGTEEFAQTETDIRYLRTYARKAERDYLRFLSKVDYSEDPDREEGAIVIPLNSLFAHENEPAEETTSIKDLVPAKQSNGEQPEETHKSALTYHPLLPDALYSLLLAHTLTLTPPQVPFSTTPEIISAAARDAEKAELNRWAKTVARLQSVCDGYPLFLPARSPYLIPSSPLMIVPEQTGSNSFVCLDKRSYRSRIGKRSSPHYLVPPHSVNRPCRICVISLLRRIHLQIPAPFRNRIIRSPLNERGLSVGLSKRLFLDVVCHGI